MQADALTLLELNNLIKEVIESGTEKAYWVIGEISELKINYSGHCYLELIQKDQESDQIVARNRATIWAQTFRLIKPYFETTTQQPLVKGLVILVKVRVEFHEVFGLSLNILDIEPTYTVGELAIRKQKVIERLTQEGVIGMNHELELPILCQKIAIISSKTAAGYGDFIDQLIHNPYGYKFYTKLFPAVMQGDKSEQSIIDALERIYPFDHLFDAVVIIRGGGSQADLSCFNSYWLAYHITQFPLPVLTGIGHEQDDSVADLVAHTRLKTPTAVAEFLIENLSQSEELLIDLADNIIREARAFIENKNDELILAIKSFQLSLKDNLNAFQSALVHINHLLINSSRKLVHRLYKELDRREVKIQIEAKKYIEKRFVEVESYMRLLKREIFNTKNRVKQELVSVVDRLRVLDPKHILKRGYSITFKNGKPLSNVKSLLKGDSIDTLLYKGKIQSIIKKISS